MDNNLLRCLLAEGESSRLDYKSQQYPFAGASDGQKGELLKDILAMANASREVDAFILIGIEEQPGGRARIVGIADHLDDADLQQFVNSKTNRPIQFSYFEFQTDGQTLAVIRIPVQRRPLFIKKRLGPVDARVVYMRRGSSTVEADPDEVHDMGVSSAVPAKPSLSVEFADLKERRKSGRNLTLRRLVLKPLSDDRLPTVSEPSNPMGIMSSVTLGHLNYAYWKEMREYVFVRNTIGGVGFAITNSSAVVAEGVRAVLTLPCAEGILAIQDYPRRPIKRYDLVSMPALDYAGMATDRRDVEVDQHGDEWHVEVTFGKVQPGSTVWTDDELLIGTIDSRELVLAGQMFGDNFEPVPIELRIVSEPTTRAMTVNDLRAHKSEDE